MGHLVSSFPSPPSPPSPRLLFIVSAVFGGSVHGSPGVLFEIPMVAEAAPQELRGGIEAPSSFSDRQTSNTARLNRGELTFPHHLGLLRVGC